MYRVAATVEQLKESTLAELQSPLCTLHMPYRYEGSHWVFRPGYTILVVQAWQQQPVPISPVPQKSVPLSIRSNENVMMKRLLSHVSSPLCLSFFLFSFSYLVSFPKLAHAVVKDGSQTCIRGTYTPCMRTRGNDRELLRIGPEGVRRSNSGSNSSRGTGGGKLRVGVERATEPPPLTSSSSP